MGWVKDEIPTTNFPERNERNIAIEAGEKLIRQYNCQGCHAIDGDGGAIQPTIASWIGDIADETNAEDRGIGIILFAANVGYGGAKSATGLAIKVF